MTLGDITNVAAGVVASGQGGKAFLKRQSSNDSAPSQSAKQPRLEVSSSVEGLQPPRKHLRREESLGEESATNSASPVWKQKSSSSSQHELGTRRRMSFGGFSAKVASVPSEALSWNMDDVADARLLAGPDAVSRGAESSNLGQGSSSPDTDLDQDVQHDIFCSAIAAVRAALSCRGMTSEWTSKLAAQVDVVDSSSEAYEVLCSHGWNGIQFSGPPDRSRLLEDLFTGMRGCWTEAACGGA